jgi:hypothetical protein
MNKTLQARAEKDRLQLKEIEGASNDRRQLLLLLSAAVGACAIDVPTANAEDATAIPPPRRALTGRDASGKSIFQSFDVTPQVVTFETAPGLAFYELYATDDVPRLTGKEPDPMLTKKGSFPKPNGSLFSLSYSHPGRRRAHQVPRRALLKNFWPNCLRRFRGWLSISIVARQECTFRIALTTVSSSGGK